jgi:putative peptidoglycan lipid II flippase
MGYGLGLLGLVAIKVLAPGFYASQDVRTPVKIAVVVLLLTQLLNLVLVPLFAHAGLALAIGLGALVNAGWLWVGLRRQGRYQPSAGWGRFLAQVCAASTLLGLGLWWVSGHWDWTGLQQAPWQRVGLMACVLALSALGYFATLYGVGLKLRALLRR